MKSPKQFLSRSSVLAACLSVSTSTIAADDALIDLLELLRDKGTLSQQEYAMLVDAAQADDEKAAQAQAETLDAVEQKVTAATAAREAASWTDKIELKGDLRTRYQYQKEDDGDARSRGRLRYRLGVIARPTAGWEVGAGLASGSEDQRSTNQSFDETFSSKGFNLDYAYMQYEFGNGLAAIAGKFSFPKYLYAPTDVMWDTDINPEGFSMNYADANRWGGWFANSGVWVLEEEADSSDDSYMVYGQLGQRWEAGGWSGTFAGAVYVFANVNFASDFTMSEGRNTDSKLGSLNLGGEIGHALGAGRFKLLAEYINNFETDTREDTAWAVGARYGMGKWGFKYIYADVDANAVPDFLPDSDRFDGLTGIYGHELEITYALLEKVILGLDYYHVTDDPSGIDQNLVQVDVNVKF